jgi:hypothetical protein
MSNYLIEDRPITFLPMLAKTLGSCERAIVLQQIHWLCGQPNSGVFEQGHKWVWGTYDDWVRDIFAMWSPHTLRKHIQKLEQQGVLISAQLRAHQHDRTKYYRVDYTHKLLEDTGNRPHTVASKREDVIASSRHDVIASKREHNVDSIYRTKRSTESATDKKRSPSERTKSKGNSSSRKTGYSDPPSDDKRRSYNPDDYDLDR